MHTSYSSLNTFLTCPQKYKFQVIDKIKTPQSPQRFLGNLIHNTLRYVHTPSSHGYPSKDEVMDYFSQNWSNDVFGSDEEARNSFEEGINILSQYFDTVPFQEKNSVIALEHRFNIKIGEHTLGGAIDRIDKTKNGFEIIDYKTNRKIPPQDSIDKDLQLSIYLRAFLTEWPKLIDPKEKERSISLTLYFLRHNIRISTSRTAKDLEKIDEEVLKVIKEIEKAKEENSFKPKSSALCDWCSYKENCPLWSHQTKDVESAEEERDIQSIGKEFIELKNQKKQLEKNIFELQKKLYTLFEKENLDQFFTPEGSIAKSLRKTYKYNLSGVLESFKSWGMECNDILRIDSCALKRKMTELNIQQKKEIEGKKELDRENYVLMVKGLKKTQ